VILVLAQFDRRAAVFRLVRVPAVAVAVIGVVMRMVVIVIMVMRMVVIVVMVVIMRTAAREAEGRQADAEKLNRFLHGIQGVERLGYSGGKARFCNSF